MPSVGLQGRNSTAAVRMTGQMRTMGADTHRGHDPGRVCDPGPTLDAGQDARRADIDGGVEDVCGDRGQCGGGARLGHGVAIAASVGGPGVVDEVEEE